MTIVFARLPKKRNTRKSKTFRDSILSMRERERERESENSRNIPIDSALQNTSKKIVHLEDRSLQFSMSRSCLVTVTLLFFSSPGSKRNATDISLVCKKMLDQNVSSYASRTAPLRPSMIRRILVNYRVPMGRVSFNLKRKGCNVLAALIPATGCNIHNGLRYRQYRNGIGRISSCRGDATLWVSCYDLGRPSALFSWWEQATSESRPFSLQQLNGSGNPSTTTIPSLGVNA